MLDEENSLKNPLKKLAKLLDDKLRFIKAKKHIKSVNKKTKK